MKLNKNEKVLIGILILIIVFGGYYKFIFTSQHNKLEALRSEKIKYSAQLEQMKYQTIMASKREKDIKVINSKLQDIVNNTYPAIQQKKVIIEIDSLLNKSKIEGSFAFSGEDKSVDTTKNSETNASNSKTKVLPLQSIVDQYNKLSLARVSTTADKASDTEAVISSKDSVEYMQAAISIKGSYDNISSFIKNVENQEKNIIISSLILNGETSTELVGTITLDFYSIPKLDTMNDDYFKWDYNNKYGKDNPFTSGKTSIPIIKTTIEDASKPKEEVKDFVMGVRSVNSDLPAIMLGTYNDKDKKTYVYDDNNIAQAVEISFIEKDGKEYYKYKVGNETYPQQYNTNGVEFTPVGKDISIAIFSNKRLSNSDKAGANVRIINKTSRVVNAYISYEDSSKPRVAIIGEGNTVNSIVQ
ncbi:hypothetical protein KPL37_11830 [Clostridium frigoris]|uniref:Type IV pilus assembly protein PilO n=1 Tax=Clostridium frigoris TaxID=205327 RepID=A0ABS6BU50_9CLOT|nr:hypothetical protein [Clostridium frigoris]MBU3160433.1 hypothetical protein [Clostridium frigoris]